MQNDSLPQYSRYRLRDTANRLEDFRCSIGWGQLNEDLEIAIACLESIIAIMKEEEQKIEKDVTPAHWIVDDHQFAGQYFRCSVCGKGYWGFENDQVADHCLHCKSVMNPDEIEYREAT